MDVAILCGRMPHFHKPLSAATEGVVYLSTKPTVSDCDALAGYQLPVEPGRAMAADLLFEIEGGEGPDLSPSPP